MSYFLNNRMGLPFYAGRLSHQFVALLDHGQAEKLDWTKQFF